MTLVGGDPGLLADHGDMTSDLEMKVYEVFERQRGVTQQDPDKLISHGLFVSRYRANRKRRELREQGIRTTQAVEREVW